MSATVTDLFCGAGGSSTGMTDAGYDVKVAANHWERAIETHSANHPDTEHLCADISAIDLRHLPKTDVLWASPTCTNCHQPAPLIHNIPTPTGTQPYCCACWCSTHDNHPPRPR